MMFQRTAGQYAASDGTAYQWAWSPKSAAESHMSWGDPKAWPPSAAEHFIHAGDGVLLDGWGGNGTYYRQQATRSTLFDAAASNCVGLPSDSDRQHDLKWNVAAAAYRLRAVDTITEESSGRSFDFMHTQTRGAPAPCSNTRLGAQTCVTQAEAWSDNNHLPPGTRVVESFRRTSNIAKGLGMSFVNDTQVPATWHVEATQNWNR
jgi:hypothetical protein